MRYLVFVGDHYYPCGGMKDWVASVECLSDVGDVLKDVEGDWYHVFDTEEREIVKQGQC